MESVLSRAERDRHAADWPQFEREVIAERDASSEQDSPPRTRLTKLVDDRLRDHLTGPSGIHVQVEVDDGMSWAAEAVIQTAAAVSEELRLGAEIKAIGGEFAEGDLPQVVGWIGERKAIRIAGRVGLLHGRSRWTRVLLYLGAVVTTAVAAASTRWILDQATTTPAMDSLGVVVVVVLGGLALFAARRIETRLDAGDERFEELRGLLAGLGDREAPSRAGEEFAASVARHVARSRRARIVVVDDLTRLHSVDRAVINELLDLDPAKYGCPWQYWAIFERRSNPELTARAARATKGTLRYALSTHIVVFLPIDQRRTLANRSHTTGAEWLEAVKRVTSAGNVDATLRERFEKAITELGNGAETKSVHLLWLLAVDASVDPPVRFGLPKIKAALAKPGRGSRGRSLIREAMLEELLPSGQPGASFVGNQVTALLDDWRTAFDRREHEGENLTVLVRGPAARAIVDAARRQSFGDHDLAAAHWVQFWYELAVGNRHPSRVRKLVDHLVDLSGRCPDLDELDARVDGAISEAARFAITECIAAAQMEQLPELVEGLADCPTLAAPEDTRRLAMLAFLLTRDARLARVPTPSESTDEQSAVCRRRLDRCGDLEEADRAVAYDLVMSGPAVSRAMLELEEHSLQAVLASFLYRIWLDDLPAAVWRKALLPKAVGVAREAVAGRFGSATPSSGTDDPGDAAVGRAEAAMELVALSVATWSLPFVSWCDRPLLVSALIARGLEAESPNPADALDLLDDAALLAGSAFDRVRDEERGGGGWSVAIDAAAQELALMCLLGVALVERQYELDEDDRARLSGVRGLACEMLELPADVSASRLMERIELAVYLWRALGLDSLAVSLAQRLELSRAVLTGDAGSSYGLRTIASVAREGSESMFGDLVRGLAERSNDNLRATYFSRAAWTFLNSDAADDYRREVALRSIMASNNFATIDLEPTVRLLLKEFGATGTTDAMPDVMLPLATVALLNITNRSTDDVLRDELVDAFTSRVDRLPEGPIRERCRRDLRFAVIERSLRQGEDQCFAAVRDEFADDAAWVWVLAAACRYIDQFDNRTAVDDSAAKLLSTIAADPSSAEWNELILAFNYIENMLDGSARTTALDTLGCRVDYMTSSMSIGFAKDALRVLEDQGRPIAPDQWAALDARDIEQKQAAVFPRLEREGRHFEVLLAYVDVLARYGLRWTSSEEWAIADGPGDAPCSRLIDQARAAGLPNALVDGTVSLPFVKLGRCLMSPTAEQDDGIEDLRRRLNQAAKPAVAAVLKMGVRLAGLPARVRGVLQQHLQAREEHAEQ